MKAHQTPEGRVADNKLWKSRSAGLPEPQPGTYRKNGITLPGRYYGEGTVDSPVETPDLEADARGRHPVNQRRFERQERDR